MAEISLSTSQCGQLIRPAAMSIRATSWFSLLAQSRISLASLACKSMRSPLYSLLDAERLRSRLLGALEAADRDAGKRMEPLRFVVIGGGATGVEIAGAIGDVLQRTSSLAFKHVDLKHASVILIDMGKTVLGPFGKHSQEYATEMLQARGVELLLDVSVKEVAKNSVTLSDGTQIPAELVIWAGGLKASAISNSLGIKAGRGGRVDVQPDLSVAGFPGVYALGDFSNFTTAQRRGAAATGLCCPTSRPPLCKEHSRSCKR